MYFCAAFSDGLYRRFMVIISVRIGTAVMKDKVTLIIERFFARVEKTGSLDYINNNRKIHYIIYTNGWTILGAFIFIPFHLFLSHFYWVILINVVCSLLCMGVLVDFWFRKNLLRTTWLTAIIPTMFAIGLFWAMEGSYQVSAYLILPAGFAFVLLGKRSGIIFSLVYSLIIAIIVAVHFYEWPAFRSSYMSIINFSGALILAFFWGFSGEQVRNQSFETIEAIADTDPLTSANNRRYFFERLDVARKEARYKNLSFAVLMFDIDFLSWLMINMAMMLVIWCWLNWFGVR